MNRRKSEQLDLLGAAKLPPQSIDAERAVLGSLMLSASAWDQVADILTAADFYREVHRKVFEAITDLQAQNRACDAVTLTEWFDAHGLTNLVAGGDFLTQLASETPSAANVVAYAEIVRDKSIQRSLLEAATQIADSTYSPGGRNAQQLLEEAERRVFAIADEGGARRSGLVKLADTTQGIWKVLQERVQLDSDLTGLPTGFTDFDRLTAGLQKSDLVVVAGRPSMGKTAFAMNIAEHVGIRHRKPVAVFSMEMSAEQLVMRLIASLGKVNQNKLRSPRKMDDLDWPRVTDALNKLQKAEVYIDETPALTPVELRSRARRLKQQFGIELIVVDYLQLMQVPGSVDNRATVIAEISGSLKALAKELNIPVIALSQLNRQLEQRLNKRPVMSDLRESGSIEQDADLIVFIYREEVYDKCPRTEGKAEAIIGKHRNGETGTIPLYFDGRWVRFSNFASNEER